MRLSYVRKRSKRRIRSRLRRFWRSRLKQKEKATSLYKIYISEFRDDDNKCASFIYSDVHSVESSVYFKKITIGGDVCRY